jgi:hypothetical protein
MTDDSVVTTPRDAAPEVASSPGKSWRAFPDGIGLDLVLADAGGGRSHEDLAEPFVTLGHRGRFSRTLLARVVGPGGGCVRDVALKVQSDDYPIAELPGWSNTDVEQQWRDQYRLWVAAGAAGAAPAIVDVLPAATDGGAPLLPSTLYCKKRRAFFTTPCPECGAPLDTCREDLLLESHGLPRYDHSLERFLYCRTCQTEGRPAKFYSMILADPTLRSRAPVGEQSDLYRALARLAREGGPLPCAGCANVPACYPQEDRAAGEVIRLLTPLSFYEYRALPVERMSLHYDELAALLGGKDPKGAVTTSSTIGVAPSRRYLFEDDPRGKLPLEILRLKLALYTQLVTAASSLHRATQLPHLALSPENVMVEMETPPVSLPRLYNFRTRILGVGTARQRRFDGLDAAGLAVPLLEPPPLRDSTYAAPALPGTGTAHGGLLAISAVSATGSGPVTIEAALTSDAFDLRALSAKDAVQVVVRQGRPVPLSLEFLANPKPQTTTRVTMRSTPMAIDSSSAQQLRALVGQPALRATFYVHPCLYAPHDLQSLGLMLFTTLAANEEQSPGEVVTAVRAVAAAIGQFRTDHAEASAEEISDAASRRLQRLEAEGPLAPRHLFHRPSEASGSDSQALSTFWHMALMLGLRALVQVPGFGFCRRHDDFDPAHPEGTADHLLAELRILGHNLDAELLDMQGKRQEIAEAVARVREQLRARRSRSTG